MALNISDRAGCTSTPPPDMSRAIKGSSKRQASPPCPSRGLRDRLPIHVPPHGGTEGLARPDQRDRENQRFFRNPCAQTPSPRRADSIAALLHRGGGPSMHEAQTQSDVFTCGQYLSSFVSEFSNCYIICQHLMSIIHNPLVHGIVQRRR